MPLLASAISRPWLNAACLMTAAAVLGSYAHAQQSCAPVGEWSVPGKGRISAPEILARAAGAKVVLIGENHENADHHRWELQTAAALGALRAKLVLGFEMFPRSVQGALDRWVAGDLSEEEFLKASDWSRVWGFETAFYLPLFQYTRLNRIPMVALNVERDLVRDVRIKGLEGVPRQAREGVSDPAPASETYLERLFAVYAQHPEEKEIRPARSDPEFQRFVQAQLLWDRAMAQGLADAAARNPEALVIGIMGGGHVAGGGVPHQLRSLGIDRIATLLPWDQTDDCKKYSADLATAVFAFPAQQSEPPRQLLGIMVESVADGVRISQVAKGSIAEQTGLRVGDVLTELAGTLVKAPAEARAIVERMAPGTWLPLKAKRQSEIVELTAKFPAQR